MIQEIQDKVFYSTFPTSKMEHYSDFQSNVHSLLSKEDFESYYWKLLSTL